MTLLLFFLHPVAPACIALQNACFQGFTKNLPHKTLATPCKPKTYHAVGNGAGKSFFDCGKKHLARGKKYVPIFTRDIGHIMVFFPTNVKGRKEAGSVAHWKSGIGYQRLF